MPTIATPSRQVLDELPGRVLKFLGAVARFGTIHAALVERGYAAVDHREGWELLHQVSGFHLPDLVDQGEAARRAMAELDAWDEPNFRLIRASLRRRHPLQAAFVFDGLAPAVGAGAVVSVATLLDRLDALESSPERKATRKADHAALETLTKRGISRNERDRLRGLIATASTPAKNEAPEREDDDAEHRQALLKLRGWYVEWSETARAVIKRRDHLIRLGLAKRKTMPKKA